jgi:putative transposase
MRRSDPSEQYQALLAEHGFVCSMSRKSNCWDNAVANRFFLNLDMECIWQRNYASHAEAKLDVANHIAGLYNCERLHAYKPARHHAKLAVSAAKTVCEFLFETMEY